MTDKKVAIMQPYFLPYIGYFQLINAVDEFVIYDNIQFTKRGWIHRNRILENGNVKYISLPLKKDSDYLDIHERTFVPDFKTHSKKISNRIQNSYKKAPYFKDVYPFIEDILDFKSDNLFEFVDHSVKAICNLLDIKTKIIISSTLNIDDDLRAKDRVIKTCNRLNTSIYINPQGGTKLYEKSEFKNNGLELLFIKSIVNPYDQGLESFHSHLSILDMLMFVGVEEVKSKRLFNYELS